MKVRAQMCGHPATLGGAGGREVPLPLRSTLRWVRKPQPRQESAQGCGQQEGQRGQECFLLGHRTRKSLRRQFSTKTGGVKMRWRLSEPGQGVALTHLCLLSDEDTSLGCVCPGQSRQCHRQDGPLVSFSRVPWVPVLFSSSVSHVHQRRLGCGEERVTCKGTNNKVPFAGLPFLSGWGSKGVCGGCRSCDSFGAGRDSPSDAVPVNPGVGCEMLPAFQWLAVGGVLSP